MRAIKLVSQANAKLLSDIPKPRLRPSYVLAQPYAWAVNPTDYHHINGYGDIGATLGVDFAGVVLEVGDEVTGFKPGDEVMGACHGGNCAEHEDGAFAEFVVCKDMALLHKPKQMKREEAAGFTSGVYTVGQVLLHVLGLSMGDGEGRRILVYGGSSGTGTLAIQIAKMLGFEVVTTCSPTNFDLVRSRGADHIFDYHDPSSQDSIHQLVGDEIEYIVDCIGSEETAAFCAPLLSSKGGHYHSIKAPLPGNFRQLRPEDTVKATVASGYTLFGEKFWFPNGMVFEAVPKDFEFGKKLQGIVQAWLDVNRIKPHPPAVKAGGIEGILPQVMATSTLGPSGKKIVLMA